MSKYGELEIYIYNPNLNSKWVTILRGETITREEDSNLNSFSFSFLKINFNIYIGDLIEELQLNNGE